jgi:hypothetical protein
VQTIAGQFREVVRRVSSGDADRDSLIRSFDGDLAERRNRVAARSPIIVPRSAAAAVNPTAALQATLVRGVTDREIRLCTEIPLGDQRREIGCRPGASNDRTRLIERGQL